MLTLLTKLIYTAGPRGIQSQIAEGVQTERGLSPDTAGMRTASTSLHSTFLPLIHVPHEHSVTQSVVKEQQRRVSTLEAELKTKDSAHGGLQAKLEDLQVTDPCVSDVICVSPC